MKWMESFDQKTTNSLPIQVNEEKYEKISQMNHAISHMFFDHTAIMNFGWIINTHIPRR